MRSGSTRHATGRRRLAYHATTWRAVAYMWDGGAGVDPAASERFAHVFVFETLAQALDFVRRYPDNFADTGPVVLELDVTGLPLEPDPQRPPLPGAWRCPVAIELCRFRARIEPHGRRHEYPAA